MNKINEKFKPNIKKCPLFAGITDADLETLLDYNAINIKTYDKNEYIFSAGALVEYVGIVLTGSIHVIQEDYWGNRRILAYFNEGGLFGEAFSCAEIEFLPVSVVATEKTTVLMIDYTKVIAENSSSKSIEVFLMKNMVKILAEKNIILTQKMNVLTSPTTRERLLVYLSSQAIKSGKSKFQIPFDRQELADYLSVNRSAMSRELSAMKAEGLIRTDRNTFELLI